MVAPHELMVPGVDQPDVFRNPSPAMLYEYALKYENDSVITAQGALSVRSGAKTGRSPDDKRIVELRGNNAKGIDRDIWWGDVNRSCNELSFSMNRERAIDYLNTRDRVFVVDAFAGWDTRYRLAVRTICERAYHALFISNMLILPSAEELETFGTPDITLYNAGRFPANGHTGDVPSKTNISIDLERGEVVILGTEYAGEMKKGIFTFLNYCMPKKGVLSMHCSANEGESGDVCLFFGLSGTGKTTLAADSTRRLIGDDEHCWTPDGVFNIEGGCYAKCVGLDPQKEPEIFSAIRFGAVLENVVFDPIQRAVDYSDTRITQNTRCSYPIGYIDNARIPCTAAHPRNIVFLTCDAFGVLPPVSRLTSEQAMYHFISGYTAKIAGTEQGISEPQATFSACFGAAFLVWHPSRYAELLAELIDRHGTKVWFVNTGWTAGGYGEGERIPLTITRRIINAIHSGELDTVPGRCDPVFGFEVKTALPGVPGSMLWPEDSWTDRTRYHRTKVELARLFRKNFTACAMDSSDAIRNAGPTCA